MQQPGQVRLAPLHNAGIGDVGSSRHGVRESERILAEHTTESEESKLRIEDIQPVSQPGNQWSPGEHDHRFNTRILQSVCDHNRIEVSLSRNNIEQRFGTEDSQLFDHSGTGIIEQPSFFHHDSDCWPGTRHFDAEVLDQRFRLVVETGQEIVDPAKRRIFRARCRGQGADHRNLAAGKDLFNSLGSWWQVTTYQRENILLDDSFQSRHGPFPSGSGIFEHPFNLSAVNPLDGELLRPGFECLADAGAGTFFGTTEWQH